MSEQTSHPSVPEMGFADAQSMGLSAEEWQLILKPQCLEENFYLITSERGMMKLMVRGQ